MLNISVLDTFNNFNILIIGDVMLDRYLTGSVSRISPEAPVPVLNWQRTDNRLGGAANVALNIKAMGARPLLCSVIGKDEDAILLKNILRQADIYAEALSESAERPTTVKARVMAGSQQMLRIDSESTHNLSEAERQLLLQSFYQLLEAQPIHLIVFQDYNKGVLNAPVIEAVMAEATKRNIPTSVDPKRDNFWDFKNVSLFKPNLKEIRDALPFTVNSDMDSLRKASEYLRQQLSHKYTLITLSERGLFIDDGEEGCIIPTHPRNIADVSGAGDTVISVASLALVAGLPIKTIAALANLAGGQVCEKVGVVPVDLEQLKMEISALR